MGAADYGNDVTLAQYLREMSRCHLQIRKVDEYPPHFLNYIGHCDWQAELHLIRKEFEKKVNGKEYVSAALRTEAPIDPVLERIKQNPEVILRLLHAAIGLATESGEILDSLKRHLFYGKPLDLDNVEEELGDGQWYTAIALDVIQRTPEQVWVRNIAKLQARYPDKFKEVDALVRDLDRENEARRSA